MKVTVNQNTNHTTSVGVGIQGPPGPPGNAIASAADVDTTSLHNGSILVYKTTTNKWTSTTTLDAQNMEGGEF